MNLRVLLGHDVQGNDPCLFCQAEKAKPLCYKGFGDQGMGSGGRHGGAIVLRRVYTPICPRTSV